MTQQSMDVFDESICVNYQQKSSYQCEDAQGFHMKTNMSNSRLSQQAGVNERTVTKQIWENFIYNHIFSA